MDANDIKKDLEDALKNATQEDVDSYMHEAAVIEALTEHFRDDEQLMRFLLFAATAHALRCNYDLDLIITQMEQNKNILNAVISAEKKQPH